ncbi:hypothetical protein ACFY7Y_36915 [Streptomyces virginiae]|uniref:hypothetical protein n=1 Tax=Streptomyces virginiae TaxID=1961 RepID=UPI0036B74ADC
MNGRTDLQAFRALLTDEGRSLLAALQEAGPGGERESAATAALRQGRPAVLVAAAEEQVRLRGLAAATFGEFALRMFHTPDLVELSSPLAVSDYKLDRVLDEMGVVLIDAMCLDSGADTLVLSWSHHTPAVDADPLTMEIAGGPLDDDGALLTSDELWHTPFATAYEVTGVPTRAPEPDASVEFVVAGADGPMTLIAVPVPVRFPQAP